MSSSSRPPFLQQKRNSQSCPGFSGGKGGWIGWLQEGSGEPTGRSAWLREGLLLPGRSMSTTTFSEPFPLTLQEMLQSATLPTLSCTLMASACLGQPPKPRAAEGGQQYSRQGSLAGDDAVRLVPFVHQPCVGLHPHPATPLGQQPEHRQPALPRLHHWGRDTKEVPLTELLHTGRQMTHARCHEVEHHLMAVLWGQEMQDAVSLPAP